MIKFFEKNIGSAIRLCGPILRPSDGLSSFSYDKTSQLTLADHAPA